ncbi:MAG: elongation factor G [Eubacteriales bacterium]
MYTAKDIRNLSLLGHGGDGKSALAESMLYLTKGTERLGKNADGNTISDFDPEEIKRHYSISTSLIPVVHKGCKINVLDNPGYFGFVGEVTQSLQVSDSGIILVSAKSKCNVGAEKSWKHLKNANLPAFFYLSKMDEDHADFFAALEELREKFGTSLVPFVFPVMDGDKAVGYVDVIQRQAYMPDGSQTAMPAGAEDLIDEYYENLCEAIAETSEELMDKYFGGEAFTEEELASGIKAGICQRALTPVYCGSGTTGFGTMALLDGIIAYAPSPMEGKPMTSSEGEEVTLNPAGKPTAYVYKTLSDQYGKNSFFKAVSGDITPDLTLVNDRTGDNEKLSRLFCAKGKKYIDSVKVACGDLGVVSKLVSVKTGDTLGVSGQTVAMEAVTHAAPVYAMAVYAKKKGQEDKIAAGLIKLNEEDQSFAFYNNKETKEMILAGVGDLQLDVLCSKLKNKYNVESELRVARIAYRETIKKKVQVHGRHKKQSGGHGQFGDVWIEFAPQDEQEDLVFAERVVGGAVPKNFFPAVEKGLRDSIKKGPLAGYPMVFLKATLYDGSYHPVDSSEMAFKTAASVAYKDGIATAGPTLLEPIGTLKVQIPDNNMGDIIGDLNKRRGRVMGMNPIDGGFQEVEAEVPMGEMATYAIDLRSMTQSRGSYSLDFIRYEEVPQMSQGKIIEAAKKAAEEE